MQALDALSEWFGSRVLRCVIVGAPGDGRTSLARMWCAQAALAALHRRGPPVHYLDCSEWRSRERVADFLGELAPDRRAALRLAVSTGNCLLVIDGLDDIFPDEVSDAPFFEGWITPRTRLLQTSCWLESGAMVLSLLPAEPDERTRLVEQPWPLLERLPFVPPRCMLAGARSQEDLEHPDGARMETYLARLDTIVAQVLADAGNEWEGRPIDVLEDLAHALWSARSVHEGESPTRLRDSDFRRFRAQRRPQGGEPDPCIELLTEICQPPLIVAKGPAAPDMGSMRGWLARESALRSPGRVERERRAGERSARWLGFVWDAVALHALARRVVGALAGNDVSVLEILPLSPEVLRYCHALPGWSVARETLARVLAQPGKSPLVGANALLLAAGDNVLASTEAAPWNLEGADLRGLGLDGVRLEHALLSRAVLRGASLRGASLRYAILSRADLTGCDLTGADLCACDAGGACFAGAALDGVSLREAVLNGAELGRTRAPTTAPDLANARLSGVSLRAAVWNSTSTLAIDPVTCVWFADASRWRDVTRLDAVVPGPIAYEGALAWSPDGHWIATGDHRGQLHLWSTGPVRCIGMRNAHHATLRAAAFSPDGTVLATAGDDQEVHLWNLDGLTPRLTLAHTAPVTGVFWESAAVLWTVADMPRRWDVAVGVVLEEFSAFSGSVYEGALVAGGRLLVLAGRRSPFPWPCRGDELLVIERAMMRVVARHQSSRTGVAAVDPAGERVVVRARGFAIYSLDRPEAGPLSHWTPRLEHSPSSAYSLETWSYDGRFVALGSGHLRSAQALALCWDVSEQAAYRVVEAAHELAWGILFSPIDHRLALVGDGGLRVLDLAAGKVEAAPVADRLAGHLERLVWKQSGLRAHSSSLIVDIELAARAFRARQMHWPRENDSYSMRSTGDTAGDLFVFADDDIFSVWDEPHRRRTVLQEPPSPGKRPTSGGAPLACFSPDGCRVMIQQAFAEKTTRFDIWDTSTGAHRYFELLPGFGSVILVDSRLYPLIETLSGEALHFVDLARNARLTVLVGHHANVYASPSVSELVLLLPTQRIRCLRTEPFLRALAELPPGGKVERAIEPSDDAWTAEAAVNAHGCAFHEKRGMLAIPSPFQVEIRRLSDGSQVLTLPTRTGIGMAAFSPNGSYLAYLWGAELQLWSVERAELAAQIFFLKDGALVIAGQRFQRLPSEGGPGSLQGFYGQVGAQLWPLERLEALESNDLCEALWAEMSRRAAE